jgi:SH2 domain.
MIYIKFTYLYRSDSGGYEELKLELHRMKTDNYHGYLSRDCAENLLKNEPTGSYLLRKSDKSSQYIFTVK